MVSWPIGVNRVLDMLEFLDNLVIVQAIYQSMARNHNVPFLKNDEVLPP